MSPVNHTDTKTTLNFAKLHKLTKESPTVDAIATFLASKQRIRGFTDLARLKLDLTNEKFEVIDQDMENLFQALEKDGCGTIVRSRKYGGKPRFIWNYRMDDVANAIITGKEVVAKTIPEKMKRLSDKSRFRKVGKKVVTNKPITRKPKAIVQKPVENTLPNQVNINGKTYIEMDSKQLEKFNKFQNLFSK